MKNKSLLIVFSGIIIAVLALSVWVGFNSILVPRIIVPMIRSSIEEAAKENFLDISVKKIEFSFSTGIIFENIKISALPKKKGRLILTAPKARMNVSYWPLLFGAVELKTVRIPDAQAFISRNAKGKWNFAPLLNLIEKQDSRQNNEVVLKKFVFTNARVSYVDRFNPQNTLKKEFSGVDLEIISDNGLSYYLTLSGKAANDDREAVSIKLDYETSSGALKGQAELMTDHLEQYWDYYIDEILHPWHLKAGQVFARLEFSCLNEVFSLKAGYKLKQGALKYGDLEINGNAVIRQAQKFNKKGLIKNSTKVSLKIDNGLVLISQNKVLRSGKCSATITDQDMVFNKITGMLGDAPVDLKGRFVFYPVQELLLKGDTGEIKHDLFLKMKAENKAVGNWKIAFENSTLEVKADVYDLKNLDFGSSVHGNIDLADLDDDYYVSFDQDKNLVITTEAGDTSLKGRVSISGRIKGEFDKPKSLMGQLELNFRNFSILDLEPRNFNLMMQAKDGLFEAKIPEDEFYTGTIKGFLVMDFKRCGVELSIDNCDISKLYKSSEHLKDLKGFFSGNIVVVSNWGDMDSMKGGGYFLLKDAHLRESPFFENVEQGINEHVKDFTLPDFKRAEGNFGIGGGKVYTDDAEFDASGMNLKANGSYTFSGKANFTVGIKFFDDKQGFFTTLRRVLLPITAGVEILTSTIRVNISGIWPNLDYTTVILPLNWINEFFGWAPKPNPDKYTLEEVWNNK